MKSKIVVTIDADFLDEQEAEHKTHALEGFLIQWKYIVEKKKGNKVQYDIQGVDNE